MTISDETTGHIREAVAQAMRTAIPETYTPELAAEFAEAMVAELRNPSSTPHPLTAAERGAEWMLRWNCTPWCINDHAAPNASEWHGTTPVETELRDADLDASGYSENGHRLPWLGAQIVVSNDKAQAYGRETRVWLSYGVSMGELPPAKAREALEAMRGFVADLEAVVDQADEIAKDDFAGDPEIAAAHEKAEARRIKRITEAAA